MNGTKLHIKSLFRIFNRLGEVPSSDFGELSSELGHKFIGACHGRGILKSEGASWKQPCKTLSSVVPSMSIDAPG